MGFADWRRFPRYGDCRPEGFTTPVPALSFLDGLDPGPRIV
jgi:hypothetical protein